MRHLIYLSPVPWDSYNQRSHEFVRWYQSITNAKIFWVDPYPTRLPSAQDIFRCATRTSVEQARPDWLTLVRPTSIPIEPLSRSIHLNRQLWRPHLQALKAASDGADVTITIGKPSMFALELLNWVPLAKAVYDAMDNFPAFYSGKSRVSLAAVEKRIAQRVDCIMVSSEPLRSCWSAQGSDVRLVRNGLASDRFSSLMPETNSSGSKIMGYVGTVSHWFDWDWLLSLARIYPDYEIRMVGPVFNRPFKKLPLNIRFLSVKDHASAINEMSQFDVGLIPFKDNELTAFVDPIKYYEYRAMGLPILTSSFGEMKQRKNQDGVYVVEHPSDMSSISCLALKRGRLQIDRLAFIHNNSWQTRFDSSGLLATVRY